MLWSQKPGFEPWSQPLLFIFICGPDFAKERNLHNAVFHRKLFYSPQRVYHCTQEIIIMTKEMANGYIIT